jgi:flavorubredoxin
VLARREQRVGALAREALRSLHPAEQTLSTVVTPVDYGVHHGLRGQLQHRAGRPQVIDILITWLSGQARCTSRRKAPLMTSQTTVTEIGEDIYRLSTFVPQVGPTGFTFNQFLVNAEEPLLFHTGHRSMFDSVVEAINTVTSVESLRWITFGHVESDECGSMNQFLAAAPGSQVAHGALGCNVSLNEMADRPPRPLADGEVIDLGGKRVRHLDTPHVPHGWEARVLYEETTGTLLCGDLFTHFGDVPALVEDDIVGPAAVAEDVFKATCLTPDTGPTIRRLADLKPRTLALMHGSSFTGDCQAALLALADNYDQRLATTTQQLRSEPGRTA